MTPPLSPRLILGQTLRFRADPFVEPPAGAALHEAGGAILVDGGTIRDIGPAARLRGAHPDAVVDDMGAALLIPGFVDAHVHYPQTAMIASWGKRLIDWLNAYTFPEEMRLSDPAYAAAIATRFFDLTLAAGTTTVCSFATSEPGSVTAFFREAEARGVRAVAGKTCMDRNAPAPLCDTAQAAYEDSKALLDRWHGVGRLEYAITPRFTPTSSGGQLAALGALWAEHPGCLMQTHLSEQVDEVAWVRALAPGARDYLDTYEAAGLLGARGMYGHAIHLEAREIDRIAEIGASVVHCPTSNSFIGSGLFRAAALKARGVSVGLATDVGGGSSFSMLRTMAAAYEIGQLAGTALHPAQLLWLATEGSARAMHMADRIGTLEIGSEADILALDLAATPPVAQRAAEAGDIWEALFPTIMMGDERAVARVWIAGVPLDRPPDLPPDPPLVC